LKVNIDAYDSYRDLAFLYTVFYLCNRGIKPISIDTVQRNFLKYFPTEKNFIGLLQRAKDMYSITQRRGTITLTKIGAKSANGLGKPIKRIIERQTLIEAEFVEV